MRRWLFAVALAACSRKSSPRLEVPIVVERPGIPATQLEREVAIPFEYDALAINGVRHVESRIETGRVVTMLVLATPEERLEVVQALVDHLPEGASLGPTTRGHTTIRYAVPQEASEPLRRQLMTVPGVADVTTCGTSFPTRIVELDALRLHGVGLLARDAALYATVGPRASGVVLRVREPDLQTVIGTHDNTPVSLGDVAQVRIVPHADCLAFDANGATTTGTVIARLTDDADGLHDRVARLVAIAHGHMLPAGTDVLYTDATDTQALSQLTSALVETGEGEAWEPAHGSRIYITPADKAYDAIAMLAAHHIDAYTIDDVRTLCGPRDKLDAARFETNAHVIGAERGRSVELDDPLPPGVTTDQVEKALELTGPGVDEGGYPKPILVHVTGDPDVADGVALSAVTRVVDGAPLVRLRQDGAACIAFGAQHPETSVRLHQSDGLR